MARQTVLSPIPQNQPRTTQAPQLMRQQGNRKRSESLSSLSSTSSQGSSMVPTRHEVAHRGLPSSVSPDENKEKKQRGSGLPFAEMFSPVRAIRAARAGMKRKRGGGPLIVASSRRPVLQRAEGAGKKTMAIGADGGLEESRRRQFRGSRRTASRDASNGSLHRGMSAMVLTDNEAESSAAGRVASSRKVSGSGSVRSTRSRSYKQVREESEEDEGDDAEEDERLLLQAPSWQLHRLKKTKLFKLHVMLGTWKEGEAVDLDLYNKQELVEGLIKSRSSKAITLEEESLAMPSPPVSKMAGLRRILTSSTLQSQSSVYTDEESTASETEANDAGGEETEAEPIKSAKRREDLRLTRLLGQSASSPMVNRLRRARSRLSNPAGDARFAPVKGKGSLTTVGSSLSSPHGKRLRNSQSILFAASSPARTRLRTRNQSSSSSMRLSLPGNRTGAAQSVFPRRMDAHTPRQQRRKRSASTKAVAFRTSSGQETDEQKESGSEEGNQEWEDASPRSLRRFSLNPPRRAKVRAQEQLHQLHSTNQEAQLDDMSVDETPTKARVVTNSREAERVEWEEDSHGSETDVHASPSKMRKLRNGKVRMPTAGTSSKPCDGEDDDEDEDVDMEGDGSGSGSGDDSIDAQTSASLNRLLRSQLVQLCERHKVEVAKDATKAGLVEALLEMRSSMPVRPPTSSKTVKPGSGVSSSGPAKAVSKSSARTSRARRAKTSKQGQVSKGESSEQRPLLLRSHSNEVQEDKPPSPMPSGVVAAAGAGQSAVGEDELNGLDLESLNLVDKEISFSKLEKLDKIGSGGFKDVYVGKYQISKKTTKKVAIADIRDQLSEMDIKELTLLRDLKHENIVRFIGVCVPPPDRRMVPCMIVSELCSNGDLFDYIRNVDAPPDEEIFRIMLETARGLEYLHTRSPAIIHRDVKSTNVLVTRNKTAKINDFGLARVRNTKRSMIKSLVGTVNWQAVELWSPKPNYNEKVDVWSAAMTFWETLQWHQADKKYPFQEMNEHQIYLDVGHKKLRPSTVSIRRHYGGEIVDLLDQMWDHNARERPTMTGVCERMEELIEMKKQASRARAAKASTSASA